METIADDLAGKCICNEGEVCKTISHPDIGNITDPDLVDTGQGDAFDQIAVLEERV